MIFSPELIDKTRADFAEWAAAHGHPWATITDAEAIAYLHKWNPFRVMTARVAKRMAQVADERIYAILRDGDKTVTGGVGR